MDITFIARSRGGYYLISVYSLLGYIQKHTLTKNENSERITIAQGKSMSC